MTLTHIPCDELGCNGHLIKAKSAFEIESKIIGKVHVPNVEQYKCNLCYHSQLTADATDYILKYVRSKEADAIASLPVGEFITPNQAIEILGCTKQAFSKNLRIKRGFIMSVLIGGKQLYHKKSVELFKLKNDGRFLVKPISVEIQWISSSQLVDFSPDNWVRQTRTPKASWEDIPVADNYQTRKLLYG